MSKIMSKIIIKHGKRQSTESVPKEYEISTDHPLKDGLPHQAFALATDINAPGTWLLPHHTRLVKKAVKGKIGYEHTVDWGRVSEAVQLISLRGIDGVRVHATEGEILYAAKHLASHFIKAHKPLPDALALLV